MAGVIHNDYVSLYLYDGTTMRSWPANGPADRGHPRPVAARRDTNYLGFGYGVCIGMGISRGGWGFTGTIDNVRVYDAALDEATLLAHATTESDRAAASAKGNRNGAVHYAANWADSPAQPRWLSLGRGQSDLPANVTLTFRTTFQLAGALPERASCGAVSGRQPRDGHPAERQIAARPSAAVRQFVQGVQGVRGPRRPG